MLCIECGKPVGLLGRLRKSSWCGNDHRLKSLAKARAGGASGPAQPEHAEGAKVILDALAQQSAERPPARPARRGSTFAFAGVMVVALGVGWLGLPSKDSLGVPASLRESAKQNAAVVLFDDFHGTQVNDAWISPGDGAGKAAAWKLDNGLLRPGSLRLWRDSMPLSNYKLEFTGQIETLGISWVLRATDAQNYYACRLMVKRAGPLPDVELVRYARINGKDDAAPVHTRLPMTVRNGEKYDVTMSVKGSNFTTLVNGQVVDVWSDDRIKSGGVGFFSGAGESALLRHVRLSERDDAAGRILSWIK